MRLKRLCGRTSAGKLQVSPQIHQQWQEGDRDQLTLALVRALKLHGTADCKSTREAVRVWWFEKVMFVFFNYSIIIIILSFLFWSPFRSLETMQGLFFCFPWRPSLQLKLPKFMSKSVKGSRSSLEDGTQKNECKPIFLTASCLLNTLIFLFPFWCKPIRLVWNNLLDGLINPGLWWRKWKAIACNLKRSSQGLGCEN